MRLIALILALLTIPLLGDGPRPNHTFAAQVVRVIDGDTIKVNVCLGMDTWIHNHSVRLLGVHSPELTGADAKRGLEQKEALMKLLPEGSSIMLVTAISRSDKYGRYLAYVYNANDINVNDEMAKLPQGGR